MEETEGKIILAGMVAATFVISAYGYHIHQIEKLKRKQFRDYEDWWKSVQQTDMYQKATPIDRMKFLNLVKSKFPYLKDEY